MKIISFIAIIVSFATESLWSAQQESHRLQIEGRVEIPDTIEEFLNQEVRSFAYEDVTRDSGEEKTTRFLQAINAENDSFIVCWSGKEMMVRDASRLWIVLVKKRKDLETEYRKKSLQLNSNLEEDLNIFREFVAVLLGNEIMKKMIELKLNS